ncbi:MAG: hypothetical protein WCY26_06210 [Thiohalobacteraceae bacterium]
MSVERGAAYAGRYSLDAGRPTRWTAYPLDGQRFSASTDAAHA